MKICKAMGDAANKNEKSSNGNMATDELGNDNNNDKSDKGNHNGE
ncbi:hypothetical protein N9L68_04060 [bacterium]|nr:hypothetical protein [bacterium]